MRFDVLPQGSPFHLILSVQVFRPISLIIDAFDTHTKRIFSKRYIRLERNSKAVFKFPIVPERLTFEISQNQQDSKQANYKITDIKLEKDTVCPIELTEEDKKFIRFIKWFACESLNLEASDKGVIYQSEGYSILYAKHLLENEVEQTTPARIDKFSGLIHVSQSRTKEYTVPMLIVVLLHEYAHLSKNAYYGKEDSNELSADLIACHIALNLGFDSYEVKHCFKEIFKRKNTDQNKKRLKAIEEFIRIFESNEGARCKTRS